MSLRALALFPLAWLFLVLVSLALTSGTTAAPGTLRAEIELGKILSLAGLWAAAYTYHKGDYLRRAWFLIGLGIVFLLARDLTVAPLGFGAWNEQALAAFRGALVFLGNLSSVIGIWMLARAWRVGGIALPGARLARSGVVVVTLALAVTLTGPSLVASASRLLAGQLQDLTRLASTLGDTISLALIAPLLLTALALRGGMFTWPWMFFTIGSSLWLVWDAVDLLEGSLGLSAGASTFLRESIRALATGYIFASGMAQRLVVLQMRRDASS